MGDPRQNLLSNPFYLGPSGTRRNSPWFKDYVSARFDNKPFDPTPYLAQIQAAAAKLPYGQDQVNRPLPVEPAPGSYATWGDAIRTRLGGERPVSPWAGREAEIAAKTQGIIPYGADQKTFATIGDAYKSRQPAPAQPAVMPPAAAAPVAPPPPTPTAPPVKPNRPLPAAPATPAAPAVTGKTFPGPASMGEAWKKVTAGNAPRPPAV